MCNVSNVIEIKMFCLLPNAFNTILNQASN